MSTLALSGLLLALSAAPGEDAPDRLITRHGVELRSEERVFLLFSALNALGYAEETQRKGPPLRAPVFHGIRTDVRDQLRKQRAQGTLEGIRALFDENSAEIEVYLEAVLAAQNGQNAKISNEAKKLLKPVMVLDDFHREAKLKGVYDAIALAQRKHAKELKTRLEADFDKAAKLLGVSELRAPVQLVVIPNPLDGHDMVRPVHMGETTFLVVGPGFETAQRAVLEAALAPLMRNMLEESWKTAKFFDTSWSTLKDARRITRRYRNPQSYLAESLARAVAFRIRNAKPTKEGDEEFVDDQARDAMRWARVALKLIDGATPGTTFSDELPKLLPKIHP